MGELLGVDFAAADPNLIYLGLMVSVWLAITAAYVPGTGLLEGLGVLGLLITFVVLAELPTSWIAVLLIVVGASLFIVMPFLKRQFASLAAGGLALQGLGAVFLFNDGLNVSIFIIVLTLAVPLAYHQYILLPMLKRMEEVPEERDNLLLGAVGRVTREINPVGTVYVNSESWSAISNDAIPVGSEVMVTDRSGLHLVVELYKRKRQPQAEVEEA